MPGNAVEDINDRIKSILLSVLPREGTYRTNNMGGMAAHRIDTENKIQRCFNEPFIVVILQGVKHAIVGSEKLSYGKNQCLITGIDLPVSGYVTNASPDSPHLAISLPIDKLVITRLMAEIPPIKEDRPSFKALATCDLDEYTLDAFFRLAKLMENVDQANVLAPMIVREIHYRLLIGPLGGQLRTICTCGTQSHQIARAVEWLRKNYALPMKSEELAEYVNMAPSTFRKHFKLITTLSPLQYQKRLRLYEAQRLMIEGTHNATTACYSVGYESPAQFNREYKRMFGEPPRTYVKKLKTVI